MRKIFLSFSARLTFYILTLTCSIFFCIALVFSTYSGQRENQQAIEYTSALQQNVILKISNELAGVETAIKLANEQVKDLRAQPDSMERIVRRVMDSNKLLIGLGIAFRPNYYKSKGRLFFSYLYREKGNNLVRRNSAIEYTKRTWYKNGMKKQTYWTDPYIDFYNKVDFMTSYVLPCRDDRGRVYAVILADVNLLSLTSALNDIQPYKMSYSFIVTKQGQYVAHPNKKLILKENIFNNAKATGNKDLGEVGKKMIANETGAVRSKIDGHRMLFCYAPMKTGWSVCTAMPYRSVMKNLGSATFTIIAMLIIGLVLLSVCIQILVQHLSKPIKELTDASYLIARGNFDVKLPRVETKDDIRKLHDAFAFMQESLAKYIKEVESTASAKERIKSELAIARAIQMELVPKKFSPFADNSELELYALLTPAKEVGGDFYDFFIRDGKLVFAIGDVSGKGVPASLVMAITRTLFRMTSNTEDSPATIVSKLNNAIAENNDTNMFVTFYAGRLDLNTGELTFCNAGHNAPLIIDKDINTFFQKVDCNLPIGIAPDFEYTNQTITLPKGCAMLLYTDGLTEAENIDKELFGDQRARDAAKACANLPAKDIIGKMTESLASFVGEAEQSDDLTMMCFRLNETSAEQANMRKLVIHNKLDESTKLVPFMDMIATELDMQQTTKSSLNLAVEEALVNVIQYAYPPETTKNISLTAKWTADKKHIEFTLKDCGKAFDPLQADLADTTLSLEDRPIGGLGILLVREIMDTVGYQRLNGENILTMGKDLD